MTQGEDVLRAILVLVNRHDADAIQAYLAEDMRFRNPITGDSDASGIHAVHSGIFAGFPDVEYRLERLLSQGDSVVVECTIIGTHQGEFAGVPATGRAINLPVAFCVDVIGGKVRDWRSYFDTATLMRQIGALPTPAETAPAAA
jgi:steroid delta-isomerase-like uncharacterized protein